jgi:ketosteroid isomerase-like protein
MENQTKITPQQIAQTFLEAVKSGNFELVGSLLAPDVKWNQPGRNRFSGLKSSAAEVFQMVGGMMEISGNTLLLAEIKSVTENGNQIACLINWKATGESGSYDVDNIDVYTISNGKITDAVIYSADLSQENAFWGKI